MDHQFCCSVRSGHGAQESGEVMRILRLVLLALVGVLAAIFAIQAQQVTVPTASPVSISSEGLDSLITAALADYEVNSGNTDNVYQQQVVAAWGIKDLTEITARQNAVIIENQAALGKAVGEVALATAAAAELNSQLGRTIVVLLFLLILAVVIVASTVVDRRPKSEDPPKEPASEPVTAEN